MGILKSYQLHLRTMKTLDFEVSYFSEGKFKTSERYSATPYKVTLDKSSDQIVDKRFLIDRIDDAKFKLSISSKSGLKLFNYATDEFTNLNDSIIEFSEEFFFGQQIEHEYFSFKVEYMPELMERYDDEKFYFKLNDYIKLANKYKSKVKLRALNKEASIIVLNMSVLDRMKGINFMNALCQQYLEVGLEDKNRVAANTLKFINNQLEDISDSLSIAESQLQNFRSQSKVMDLDFTSIKAFENLEKYQKEKVELLTQDKYYKYLLDYVTTTTVLDTLVAPSLMGINDQLLNNLLQELSSLYKDRAALDYNSQDKNPALQRVNAKLSKTKSTLVENVNGLISASEIRLGELKKSVERTMARVNELPKNERDLINIERKFNLNDQLYKYLLQKRAEASIALASNISDHKVLDEAQMLGDGPSPTAGGLTYGVFGFLGLAFPLVIIIVKGVVQGKITGENQLKHKSVIPYVGAIGINKTLEQLPLKSYPNSPISESFRVVKSNIEHRIKGKNQTIIGVTSATSKEGKSFIASNLAVSYALAGNRVLLIAADLRKPDTHELFGISNSLGLSGYLNNSIEEDLIFKSTFHDQLDFIPSGLRTLYPSELLETEKFEGLMKSVRKKYDVVIIDSPPLGVVSDFFILAEHTDVNLFVARDNHSTNSHLTQLNELHLSKRVPNCLLVFNHFKDAVTQNRTLIKDYYEFTHRKSIREIIKRKLKLSI